MRRLWSLGLGMVFVAMGSQAGAQGTTVGTTGGAGIIPFGYQFPGNAVTRYEQSYSPSAFTGPITIQSIAFGQNLGQLEDLNEFLQPGDYDFYFSVSSVNTLSSDLDANLTSPEQLFAHYVATGTPFGSGFTVTADNPFTYDPATGTLVLDLWMSNITPSSGAAVLLATDVTGDLMSRAWAYNVDAPGSITHDQAALVTTFNGPPSVVAVAPEPSSLALLGTGLLGVFPVYWKRRRV